MRHGPGHETPLLLRRLSIFLLLYSKSGTVQFLFTRVGGGVPSVWAFSPETRRWQDA